MEEDRKSFTLGNLGDKYGAVVVDTSAISIGEYSLISDSLIISDLLLDLLNSFKRRHNFVFIESVNEEISKRLHGIKKVRRTGKHSLSYVGGKKSKKEKAERCEKDTRKGLNDSFVRFKAVLDRLNSSRIEVDSDFFDCFFDIVGVVADYTAEQFPDSNIRKEGSFTDEEVIASAYSLAFDMRKPIALAHCDKGIRKVNNFVRRMLSGFDLVNRVNNKQVITCFLHYPVVGYTRQSDNYRFVCDCPPRLTTGFRYDDSYLERLAPFASKLEELIT